MFEKYIDPGIKAFDHVFNRGHSSLVEKAEVVAEIGLGLIAIAALSKFDRAQFAGAANIEKAMLPKVDFASLTANLKSVVAPPQLPFAMEFAWRMHDAIKIGSSGEKALKDIEVGLNYFRVDHFPYVPQIRMKLMDDRVYAVADSARNEIQWFAKLERNSDGTLTNIPNLPFEHPNSESMIAAVSGHEFVHTEQDALRWWRRADQLGIGSKATAEQLQKLLKMDPADSAFDSKNNAKVATGVPPENFPEPLHIFIPKILESRNGNPLDAVQAVRADRLIQSFSRIDKNNDARTKFDSLTDNAAQFVSGGKPDSADGFINFYDRVRNFAENSSLPVGLRGYVSRMTELRKKVYPYPSDEEMGRLFYSASSAYATTARSQASLLAHKPYLNLFHEQEDFQFTDAVKIEYEQIVASQKK